MPKEGLICRISLADGSMDVKRISDNREVTTAHDKEALKTCADEIIMEGEQGNLFYQKVIDYVESGMNVNTRIVIYGKKDWKNRPNYMKTLSF